VAAQIVYIYIYVFFFFLTTELSGTVRDSEERCRAVLTPSLILNDSEIPLSRDQLRPGSAVIKMSSQRSRVHAGCKAGL